MKKNILLFGLFALLGIIACRDKFLDVTPLGVLNQKNLSTKAGVDLILTGAYSLLDGVQTNVNSPYPDWTSSSDNWVYGSVYSDDAYKGSNSGDQPEISSIETYTHTSDFTHFRGKWRAAYDGVARANDVIQLVPKTTDMLDAEKTTVIAQARFLRGHYHFEAKKVFNKVPYIDDKIYDITNANSTKVPNDKDIWSNIEADLKFAYDNLPARFAGQPGRANRWSAGAMLAKAYLFQKKYAEAKPIFERIIAEGGYKLVDKFHDNHNGATNNNSESIFEIQFSVNDGAGISNNGNRGHTLNYPYAGKALTTCCGFFQPSQNLVNAYKTDANGLPLLDTWNQTDVPGDNSQTFAGSLDPRLDWTVGRDGVPYLDWSLHEKEYIRDRAYAGPFSPKKQSPLRSQVGSLTWTNNPRQNANNYRMIRLSHVMLWLAECEVELPSGDLEKARGLVNQIRKRASNPDGFVKMSDGKAAGNYVVKEYLDPWSNRETARKAVRFEMRIEWAMEGHRFFDLVRWGVADVVLNEYLTTEQTKRTYLRGAKFKKGKHEYFPIPNQEILNSQLDGKPTLVQNPEF